MQQPRKLFLMGLAIAVLALGISCTARAETIDTTAISDSTSGASTNTKVENALSINNSQLERTTLRTAPGQGLAAATNSFSSDYCGGTAQAGGSGLGWSLGVSKQAYDKNCQALRRVEKFGQLSAHAENVGLKTMAYSLAAMAAWELCSIDAKTLKQCLAVNLVKEIAPL